MNRREFLGVSGASLGAAALGSSALARADEAAGDLPPAVRALEPMTATVTQITAAERGRRVERAQALMQEHHIDALFLEAGTSMRYFLGVDFFRSERMVAALIPVKGKVTYVAPAFEEGKLRESMQIEGKVHTWHEHQSPYELAARTIEGLGRKKARVGIEERVRFFLYDGIRQQAPHTDFVLATPVTAGCRMFKSPAELALMQHASDVTVAAYKALIASLSESMTQYDFVALSRAAHSALGFEGRIYANFGAASAFPHGSSAPQQLGEGDIVLMDGGCSVDGYRSDISRTIVFGEPSQRQVDVWNVEREAQQAATAAIEPGVPCEAVDAAARAVIEAAGFGGDYQHFTHRVGHGIGMDGHEWPYLVRGNTLPLAPGMCFSNEPGIYLPGEFGVRLEDCFAVTENGGRFFSQPSPAIDRPFS